MPNKRDGFTISSVGELAAESGGVWNICGRDRERTPAKATLKAIPRTSARERRSALRKAGRGNGSAAVLTRGKGRNRCTGKSDCYSVQEILQLLAPAGMARRRHRLQIPRFALRVKLAPSVAPPLPMKSAISRGPRKGSWQKRGNVLKYLAF